MTIVVKYKDEIAPFLKELQAGLSRKMAGAPLKEIGGLMSKRVKDSMEAGIGMADDVPYAEWTEKYAKKRGAGRILYKEGDLARSWRWRVSRKRMAVIVYPGGFGLEEKKARGHDGGLAERYGKEKWNRLRLGFNDELLDIVSRVYMDEVMEGAAKRSRGKRNVI